MPTLPTIETLTALADGWRTRRARNPEIVADLLTLCQAVAGDTEAEARGYARGVREATWAIAASLVAAARARGG